MVGTRMVTKTPVVRPNTGLTKGLHTSVKTKKASLLKKPVVGQMSKQLTAKKPGPGRPRKKATMETVKGVGQGTMVGVVNDQAVPDTSLRRSVRLKQKNKA